jgi:signal transduction histidine kinase
VSLGTGNASYYQASSSPIIDRRGFQLGRFILLQDITEQKLSQARILDQERALATLRERELLARELHDGIGQLAAAAHLQVRFAGELLAGGNIAQVELCLHDLADTTQEIKQSIREYLAGVKTCSSTGEGFLTGLRKFIGVCNQRYGIQTELVVPPELEKRQINPTMEAQLQPIIHEALINAGKHSGARSARVIFAPSENRIRVTIEDDGRGFEPEALGGSQGFGLRSMRGRADSLGAGLEVNSTPGKGTRVSIEVPWQKDTT